MRTALRRRNADWVAQGGDLLPWNRRLRQNHVVLRPEGEQRHSYITKPMVKGHVLLELAIVGILIGIHLAEDILGQVHITVALIQLLLVVREVIGAHMFA